MAIPSGRNGETAQQIRAKMAGCFPNFQPSQSVCKTSELHLPVSSVVEGFKTTKARAVSILVLSEEEKVRHTNKIIKGGRKWKPQEVFWKYKDIIWVVCQGRLGLGNYNARRWSKASAKGKRGLMVQRVQVTAEEDRHVKAVGLACQGQWMQWDQALNRSLSWRELWGTDQKVKAN